MISATLIIWAVLSLKPATAVDDSRGNLVPVISRDRFVFQPPSGNLALPLFDLRGVNDGRTPPPSDLNVRTKSLSLDLVNRFVRQGWTTDFVFVEREYLCTRDNVSKGLPKVSSPVGEVSTPPYS